MKEILEQLYQDKVIQGFILLNEKNHELYLIAPNIEDLNINDSYVKIKEKVIQASGYKVGLMRKGDVKTILSFNNDISENFKKVYIRRL